jgi:hypothetical protein
MSVIALVACALVAQVGLSDAPPSSGPGGDAAAPTTAPLAQETVPDAGTPETAAPVVHPPIGAWHLEAPLLIAASSPPSGVNTNLATWLVLRGGRDFDVGGGFDAGGDVALWLGGYEGEGTIEVSGTRIYSALETRGSFGWRAFETTHAMLRAYGFAGARLGVGLGYLSAFDDSRALPLGLWGLRTGVGLNLSVWGVTPQVELALGARDARFELTGAVALGARF